jgi:Outer membrane lipoprotein-sorting protein
MRCAMSDWTMRLIRTTLCGIAAAVLTVVGAAAHAQSAQEIITASDRIRNPSQPFRSVDTLTEYVGGKARNENILIIYSKEDPATRQFRNLVRYAEPPRDAGKMVLLDGKVLWFYDPASKASVRISPQQRLIGQASVADVLTVNLAADYSGTLLGNEAIQDASRQERQCWHLDMKATNDQGSYGRVEYWVERTTYYPIKAKLYSDSGRLLKILYYRKFEERLGRFRPAEGIIIDAVDSSLVTTIKFGESRFREIPEAWFQREYLPRLRADQ